HCRAIERQVQPRPGADLKNQPLRPLDRPLAIRVEYPVPHSEVEQTRHNPAFIEPHYRDLRGHSCSVPPIPMPVMTRIKAATGKALIVRTLCDGVARDGLQSGGKSRGVDQIIVPRPAP